MTAIATADGTIAVGSMFLKSGNAAIALQMVVTMYSKKLVQMIMHLLQEMNLKLSLWEQVMGTLGLQKVMQKQY